MFTYSRFWNDRASATNIQGMTPKIFIVLSILCLAAAIGCKKKSVYSNPVADQIEAHAFNPLIALTSVDSFYTLPGASSPQLSPSDSSVTYLLDLDRDSVPDFNVTVKHWYQLVSNSNPGANYNYQMSISGIQTSSEIASLTVTPIFHKARLFDFSESISAIGEWKNDLEIMRSGSSTYGPHYDFSYTKYIGLRVKKDNSYHYGWLKIAKDPIKFKHQLWIESLGYNKSGNNDIRAGQEQ